MDATLMTERLPFQTAAGSQADLNRSEGADNGRCLHTGIVPEADTDKIQAGLHREGSHVKVRTFQQILFHVFIL